MPQTPVQEQLPEQVQVGPITQQIQTVMASMSEFWMKNAKCTPNEWQEHFVSPLNNILNAIANIERRGILMLEEKQQLLAEIANLRGNVPKNVPVKDLKGKK